MALAVLVDPTVVDQPDGDRIEVVELLPAFTAIDDEPGSFEHLQVLHHAEARHLQLLLELGQRPAPSLEQPVEQMAARLIGQGLEDQIVLSGLHVPDYM